MLPRWLKLTHCPLSYNLAASVDVEMKDWMRSAWWKSQQSHHDDDGPGPLSEEYQKDKEEVKFEKRVVGDCGKRFIVVKFW